MKIKHLNFVLNLIILLSIIINFNSFLMGSDSSLINTVITMVYIIFWYVFIGLSKASRKNLIFSAVWSLFTFVCAATTLAVNINHRLIVDFIIPFAMIFLTPLYGIEIFFNQSKFLITSIANIIISLTWLTMSLTLLKISRRKNQ